MFQHFTSCACAHPLPFGPTCQQDWSSHLVLAKQIDADLRPRREPEEPLVERLACLLAALPVQIEGHDEGLAAQIAALGLAGSGLILRRIRVADGRLVNLVVLPESVRRTVSHVRAVVQLRRREQRSGRCLVVIGEATVDREPRLSNARLVSRCAGFLPRTAVRLRIAEHLTRSGSADLIDLLRYTRGQADPAAAILALVADKTLTVDLDEPLGPDSPVRLNPQTRRQDSCPSAGTVAPAAARRRDA